MTLMLGGFSAIISHPREKIRLHARDVGGGFGVRSDAYSEYCTLMLAAKTLGKPVKWVGTRAETFVSDHHGRAARLIGELALDRDGTFLALRLQWIVNAGAYLSHPGPLINTLLPGVPRHQPLPDPGALRPPPAGAHQHHPDHGLSRRRPAERLVHRRAPGRGGGARNRASTGSSCAGGTCSARTSSRTRRRCRCRSTTAAIRTATWTWCWRSPDWKGFEPRRARGPGARQAARDRLRGVRRAGGRRRQPEGGGGDPLRLVGQRASSSPFRGAPARVTRRCTRRSRPRSSAWIRRRSRCGRAIPTAPC